ncbi:hypothetical protein CPT_Moogle112 [Citrobacter phage Moogle]|uniref:Uncharacterized protein n=2 Tax=Mooglevirus moogle TaxID=1985304 RepID=A0A0A0RQC1_9CAUD|nr:hypothetical protein CPT_Moogle112 [Citrobacter phage Moogle]AIW03849.1 hypothetical protein CPT_Moogle112 [Citrobacter phage Moogle]ARB06609.1 hypothetical protein CPT_Mijalis114 [Citrobacter phage Mijalis]
MFIAANVRTKLSQLLNNIQFIESMRRQSEAAEWYYGKINKKEVIVCVWNFCKEYKKPLLQVDIYDNTNKSSIKTTRDMIDSYEISHTGKLFHKGVNKC